MNHLPKKLPIFAKTGPVGRMRVKKPRRTAFKATEGGEDGTCCELGESCFDRHTEVLVQIAGITFIITGFRRSDDQGRKSVLLEIWSQDVSRFTVLGQ
jgi:hypothetical protein